MESEELKKTPEATQDEGEFESYQKSQEAVRDILYMYRELLMRGCGLYDDFGWEDGSFDPLSYIDISDDEGFDSNTLRLLREGSAIKILCEMLLYWGQGGYPEHKSYFMESIMQAYQARRFRLVPELEEAVRLGFGSANDLRFLSPKIWRNYIFAYFDDLLDDLLQKRVPMPVIPGPN